MQENKDFPFPPIKLADEVNKMVRLALLSLSELKLMLRLSKQERHAWAWRSTRKKLKSHRTRPPEENCARKAADESMRAMKAIQKQEIDENKLHLDNLDKLATFYAFGKH